MNGVNGGLRDRVERVLGAAYTIERELGGGGMSRVYVAIDNALGRQVVIKVLPPDMAAGLSIDRFRREIMLAAGLQHPHIVGVLSAGEADGLPYFIMPFVEGESLRAKIARGRLGIPETVRILRDVARALSYAHERGIVHRDIKPDNVLLSGGSACVADFGVAKALSSARLGTRSGETSTPVGTLTQFGTSLGTPAYMAPEQAAADPATDHRADIYSFGVMAYEMLVGAPPFRGATPQALLAAQLTQPPEPLAVHRSDVPKALAEIVMRCLEKEPNDRPQRAEAVVGALDDPAVISGAFVSTPTLDAAVALRTAPPPVWRQPRVLVPAIALGIGAIAIAIVATRDRPGAGTTPATPAPAAAAAPAANSIAVLPMVNIGRDSADQYFADGMTEEITSKLSRVRGLRVASRTAAAATRGSTAAVAEMGKQLNVATLLEGTVQRDKDRLRLTARLINVADGYTLWSDVFESEAKDVFAVQDQISQSIVDALGQELAGGRDAGGGTTAPAQAPVATATATTDTAGRGTASLEAYNAYLRGRFFLERRGEDGLKKALGYFQQAAKLDPKYALAHAGIADAYALIPLYGNTARDAVFPLALAAANEAIALDSTLADGYAARGNLRNLAWQWADAERDLRRAITLKPAFPAAHQWLGENLLVNGRVDEAVAELKRAAELDPVSPIVNGSYALALGVARKFDEGIARAKQAVDLDPELYAPRFFLGAVHLYAGHKADAIRELEAALALSGGSLGVKGALGYAYAVAGDKARANTLLAEMLASPAREQNNFAIARVYLGLGDMTRAFALLDRAADRHDSFFTSESLFAPLFDPMRNDPRFAALAKKVGIR